MNPTSTSFKTYIEKPTPFSAKRYFKTTTLAIGGTELTIKEGNWLVKNSQGQLFTISNAEFRSRFVRYA